MKLQRKPSLYELRSTRILESRVDVSMRVLHLDIRHLWPHRCADRTVHVCHEPCILSTEVCMLAMFGFTIVVHTSQSYMRAIHSLFSRRELMLTLRQQPM
jgi:hypothetical protein